MVHEQSGSQLRVPKAAELLAARIRGQIIRGELKEGDALPAESELMETFGVSRPTLREAIRVLEMESLLRMRRGSRGGALVTAPDPTVAARAVGVLLQLRGVTLRDIHEARTMIEPMAARHIAESRDSRAALETLHARNEAGRAAVRDFREFPHLSWGFHRGLIEGTQEPDPRGPVADDRRYHRADCHQQVYAADGPSRGRGTGQQEPAFRAR